MKTVRLAVAMLLVFVVVGGYAASQIAYLRGFEAAADFEVKVNDPRVHILMLLLFAAAVVLAFVPDREDPAR